MREVKTEKITLRIGEVLDIREIDGQSVCPVCGHLCYGTPAYSMCRSSTPEQPDKWSEPFGCASFDCCPCCNVQYGNDDYDDEHPVATMWNKLRFAWLDRVGWGEDALAQLRGNLDIIPTRPL